MVVFQKPSPRGIHFYETSTVSGRVSGREYFLKAD